MMIISIQIHPKIPDEEHPFFFVESIHPGYLGYAMVCPIFRQTLTEAQRQQIPFRQTQMKRQVGNYKL